jgi:hypothetical protein
MPMKDSWGGVQNVWFVSPALFPLFVGAMIGAGRRPVPHKALKTVGLQGPDGYPAWLTSSDLVRFLRSEAMIRFHA